MNTNFSIISPNCWGGFLYQYFGLRYNTPFVGLFLYLKDYILLLENFEYFMKDAKLSFIYPQTSKYYGQIKSFKQYPYPIGLLDDLVEIHFLHYENEEEAKNKWTIRKKRINFDNLLIKISESQDFTEEIRERFNILPFKNKICFSRSNHIYDNCIVVRSTKLMNWREEWQISKKMNLPSILNTIKK